MKLKKIEQILKRNKTIILYHGPDDIQSYIELFARNTTPGWDVWGNEVNKYA